MNEPIRVGFCITDLDIGGAEQALVELVLRLDRDRFQPHVVCLGEQGVLADRLVESSVPVVALGAKSARDFGVLWRLIGVWRAWRPDVVQTFLFHANVAGRLAARWLGIRPVFSGMRVAEREQSWHVWLDRMTSQWVARYVCVSNGVAEHCRVAHGTAAERVVVIPNGVDVARFEQGPRADLAALGIPATAPVFIAIGRLEAQKGIADLLLATDRLFTTRGDAHLLIVGDGSQRPLVDEWRARSPHRERVHMLGWRPDIPDLLRASTALVLASHWEGMPNVVLEAMAARRPVVATDAEGVAELVRSGETGLIVPRRQPQELAAAMQTLLELPDQGRAWGAAGHARVHCEFSWDIMAARYAALYESTRMATGS